MESKDVKTHIEALAGKTLAWMDKYGRPRRKPVALSPQGQPYATFNRRMFAATIDAFIITFLFIPFNDWATMHAYQYLHVDQAAYEAAIKAAASEQEANIVALKMLIEGGLLDMLGWLLQLQVAVVAAYSFLCWHFWSATPGKLLMRMRIVDAKTGARMTDAQSMLRIAGYFVAGIPLLLGFFAIGWSKTKQGWHDKLARTAVVVATTVALPVADPSVTQEPAAKQ